MRLRQLILRKFRNYENLELSFYSDLILFVSPNAHGKTNILESIFMSCTGRSHRTSKDREMIKWGEEEASIRTRVDKQLGASEIAISLHARDKKKVLINQNPVNRLGELMGHLNSVMFSPDDLKLIREGPAERRRFIDIELSRIRPIFYYLQQYNRILSYRNNLLKSIQTKPSPETFPAWDNSWQAGSYIIRQRKLFMIPCRLLHRNTQPNDLWFRKADIGIQVSTFKQAWMKSGNNFLRCWKKGGRKT